MQTVGLNGSLRVRNILIIFIQIVAKVLRLHISKSINQRKVFSILTRSASPNILHIHHRAPVALTEDYWELWLDEKQPQDSLRTLTEVSQPKWKAQQVSSRVNSTRNNDPEIVNPYSGNSLCFLKADILADKNSYDKARAEAENFSGPQMEAFPFQRKPGAYRRK